MNKIVFLLLFLGFSFVAKADQLAWISKVEAQRALDYIKTQKSLYLFCGCCDNDQSEKIAVYDVEIRYTGYDELYEVVVTVQQKDKSYRRIALDLAYVWCYDKDQFKTIGTKIGAEHDQCKPYPGKK